MTVELINPFNGLPLTPAEGELRDPEGNSFPILQEVPRVCEESNYTANFGLQWTIFQETQIDGTGKGQGVSEDRFFKATAWDPAHLDGLDILEVGSGAGRFSRVVLERTSANLWSVDYSSAVEANLRNNGEIAPDRFHLFQASIYQMPFPDGSFDKVFCMGVLQHTPDFEASVRALVQKTKPGGEIVVDFYPVKGFWTKLNAKYLLRPFTKRMKHEQLLRLIRANAGWMIALSHLLVRSRLSALTRFIPICDIRTTLPQSLSEVELREWVVLDTFDMFSPEYDRPQRLNDVASMFVRAGARVSFADFVPIGDARAAIVRAVRN